MRRSVLLLVLPFALLALLASPSAVALEPVLNLPGNLTEEATGPSGAAVSFSVTVTDEDSPPPSASCSHGSGDTFPLGTTTVSCTATDSEGLTGSGSFSVTVQDTTAPSLSLPSVAPVEATGPAGAAVSYSGASATDTVSGSLTPSCAPASGSTFALGTTAVNCTATDGAGNSTSGSFSVTVQDTTAPTVTVPSGPTVEATGPSGAPVGYSGASATDTVSGALTPSCSPASGSTFAVGTTTVTCTATDGSGNSGSASFVVTVRDTTDPVIVVPGGQTAEATGPSGAAVSYSGVSATDTVSGPLSPSCSPASGSTFPLGATTVNCTATDGAGNSASGSFPVTVRDTTDPVVAVPGPVTAEATGPAGANVSFNGVSATDTVSGNVTPRCSPASGSTFALGATTVKCTATDGAGNSGSASFSVTVRDRTGPGITNAPADIVVEANGPKGSAVRYTYPVAVDAVDGPVPTTCSPGSGANFSLGETRVDCRAADSLGNETGVSFLVTVADRTAPVLTVPAPVTISTQGAENLPATAASLVPFLTGAVATDLVDGKVAVTNDAPAALPLGTTTVTFLASDKAGNGAKATSRVTLVKEAVQPTKPLDRTPPENVRGLTARAADRAVTLSWRPPPDRDFKQVVITRATQAGSSSSEAPVYRGPAKRFVDKRLTNGVEYRYVVISYDQAGNRSAGVAIVASPRAVMLVNPADGARVKGPPLLRWRVVPGAPFYNVQLFRGRSLVKILTAWPNTNRFQLKATWVHAGRKQRLVPGLYRWFVWPSFGRPSARTYGPLLGQSTFTIVAGKK